MLHCHDRQRLYDSGIEEDQKKERTSDGRRRTPNGFLYTPNAKQREIPQKQVRLLSFLHDIFDIYLSVYVSRRSMNNQEC